MSKEKGSPIKLLVVDDQVDFVEKTLKREARSKRILLEHATNLEDAVAILQEKGEKAFAGIILDVICLKSRTDQIPDASFIGTAIKTCEAKVPGLPRAILTGEPGTAIKVNELLGGEEKVFIKELSQLNIMFDYFIEQSHKLPHIIIRKQYDDVFEIFERGYLGHDAEQDILNCLLKMTVYDPTVIADNLSRLRRIQEKIYLALNKINPQIVLTTDIDTNGANCRKIMTHLHRHKYFESDKIIHRFGDLVYSISSDYGSHVPNTFPDYPPTKYTVQALTFAIVDLLLWFKGLMESQGKGLATT